MKKRYSQEELAAMLVEFAMYARLVRNNIEGRARQLAGQDQDLFQQLIVVSDWLR